MKKIILLVAIIGTIACNTQQANNGIKPTLSINTIFNIDSVALFIKQTPGTFKDSSQQIFLQALQLFINQKNPIAATNVFLQALMVYPNANAYYELGNAYLESAQYKEALTAYAMAEKLDYKPLNAILFKQACCYAEMNDPKSFDYLSYAIENGFVNRDKIFNEPHFKNIRKDSYFTTVYTEAMAGNGDPDAILWEGYSKEFPTVNFPFTIDTGSYANLTKQDPISYSYEKYVTEMRDYKFSRDVGNEFFYYAKINSNDSVTVVIYGSRAYSAEEENIPVYYYLACFNNKGKLLDKKLIAGHKLLDEPAKTCLFTANNAFEISEYKNEYKQLKDNNDLDTYKVVKRNFIKKEKFIITSNGNIITG